MSRYSKPTRILFSAAAYAAAETALAVLTDGLSSRVVSSDLLWGGSVSLLFLMFAQWANIVDDD